MATSDFSLDLIPAKESPSEYLYTFVAGFSIRCAYALGISSVPRCYVYFLNKFLLSCNIKGVTKGFPLGIDAQKLETTDVDFNPDFLRSMFMKLDWKAFHDVALSCLVELGLNDIPEQVKPSILEDMNFLQKFHHALLEGYRTWIRFFNLQKLRMQREPDYENKCVILFGAFRYKQTTGGVFAD